MELNTKIWKNEIRLRESLFAYAKMLLVLSIINLFYVITQKNWILVIINSLYILPALITIISKFQYNKLPPKS